jgi:hypothetical protein
MRTQEEAFRAYYAAMTDAELMKTAANRNSFIDIAQKFLLDELAKRNLAVPPATPPGPSQPETSTRASGRFARILRRGFHLPRGR